MKLIEKLAKDHAELRHGFMSLIGNNDYFMKHGLITGYEAGFRKAREMASEHAKRKGCTVTFEAEIEHLGEEEV